MKPTRHSADAEGADSENRGVVTLGRRPLSLGRLDELYERPLRVRLSDTLWRRIEAGAEAVTRIADSAQAAYGINTGFGTLCRRRISRDQLETLQRNLILSHAVGVGPPAPDQIVRWMILFKIHALSHGVSGVARNTVEALSRLLEADVLPIVPTQGSLGASGDLAPLAHMVLPLLGEGTVRINGKQRPAGEAIKAIKLDPITLGPKEGLALINGTQFMSAYAASILIRAVRLLKHADVTAAMSLEGAKGSVRPFDERLHKLRPHPGAIETAANMRGLMVDSEVLKSHEDCDRVQDPYSLRCVPQVHGASRDAIRHAAEVVEREINSVTDNPLILDGDEVISGGLFHGQPLALVLDYLAIALAELGSISERRTYLLLGGADGLPIFLTKGAGLNSGLMMPQYTAAALVSENKGLCTPASVDSIPTSLGQEDHVSMGARAGVKCWRVLENVETILAIEQLCAAQAIDFREPLKPGVGIRAAHAEVRKTIAHADQDRLLSRDIEASLALLRSGRVVSAAERATQTLA